MGECGIIELRDQIQATSFAVESRGRFVALGSRRHLALVSIGPDDTCTLVRKVTRAGKWDVGTTVWSPHVNGSEMFALSSNQKIEVYAWQRELLTCVHSITAHSRIVSDIDWSLFQPNLIASASVDEFIHTWDLRNVKKPAQSFSVAAGASQVRFCHLADHVLASCLEGDVKVWDLRKTTTPMVSIAAHISKIHGIDWSYQQDSVLLTASQDCTVKLWDFRKPTESFVTIATQLTPIWRAKFTPSGMGLVTTAVPQVRRGDNSLNLWSLINPTAPVSIHSFLGHFDTVLDFHWRPCIGTSSWQLLSLSKDLSLRLWHAGDYLRQISFQSSASHSNCADGQFAATLSDITNSAHSPNALSESSSAAGLSSASRFDRPLTPVNLEHEFAVLEKLSVPGVSIENVNRKLRSVTVSCRTWLHFVHLTISYSAENTPNQNVGGGMQFSFQFIKDTTVSSATRLAILKHLQHLCRTPSPITGSFLEQCLKSLPSILAQSTASEKSGAGGSSQASEQQQSIYASAGFPLSAYSVPFAKDASLVPFPRTSGSRFCSVGILVCFGRLIGQGSSSGGKIAAGTAELQPLNTPRSMSALQKDSYMSTQTAHLAATGKPEFSISAFYNKEPSVSSSKRKQSSKVATKFSDVYIYDISDILPVSKELAINYVISSEDIAGVCSKNAFVAASANRKDLVQMWTVIGQVFDMSLKPSDNPDAEVPWLLHPFGRKLVESYIQHFCQFGDIQTAAVLACILSEPRAQSLPPPALTPGSSASQDQSRRQSGRTTSILSTTKKNSDATLRASQINDESIISKVRRRKQLQSIFGGSLYNTVSTVNADVVGESIRISLRHRSNSLSEVQDWVGPNRVQNIPNMVLAENELEVHRNNTKLLNPSLYSWAETIKKDYAELLYRWGLLCQRAQVLKFSVERSLIQPTVFYDCVCHSCGTPTSQQVMCPSCKKIALRCVICEMTVKGLATVCPLCGHGGHAAHMVDWFMESDQCPSGCGCRCSISFGASAVTGGGPPSGSFAT